MTTSIRLTILLALASVACQPPMSEPPESPAPISVSAERGSEQAEVEYHYSPFMVEIVDEDAAFTRITFKDVGMGRETMDPADPLLEAMAEALSYQLSHDPAVGAPASVAYDASLIDPSNHLNCEANHLYVDVWRTRDHWGYSLWSGCSKMDNFATGTAPFASMPDDGPDLASEVEPLSEGIAESLAEARSAGCYKRSC